MHAKTTQRSPSSWSLLSRARRRALDEQDCVARQQTNSMTPQTVGEVGSLETEGVDAKEQNTLVAAAGICEPRCGVEIGGRRRREAGREQV